MSPAVVSWLAAGALALPIVLALPAYADPDAPWAQAGLWLLTAAFFAAAAFVARRAAHLERGRELVGGFAALYLVLALLDLARTEPASLRGPIADLALVFLLFYGALAAARLWLPLGRVVLLAGGLALVVAALVRAVHAASFAAEIDAEGYRAIYQTSIAEALEFLSRFVATWTPAAALALLALVLVVAWFAPAARLPGIALAWAAPYALGAVALAYATAGPVLARLQVYTEAYEYFSELRAYRELREARNRMRPLPAVNQAAPLASEPQTYVFAIGESLTRNHMSLYGYWRETTPELVRVAAELAVFTDVVSPHSHTDPSLERVLTLANDANGLSFSDPANHGLIELLRAAGFTTWWISNQNTAGPWDNKTAVLASAADHVRYLNEGTGPFVSGAYDEVLLEPFAAALAHPAPRKAIFLHFLGNHWEYVRRYPAEESVFSAPHGPREIGARTEVQPNRLAVVNYDNAVRYHDKLLGRVLARLREAGGASAFVFLSDHGESVFEAKGHHWKLYTREHVEVPLVVWLSPELRRLAPGTWERARAGAARPFALEDLPHLVADLAGLESAVFERSRSPISESYRAPERRPILNKVRIYEEGDDPLQHAQRALAQFGELRPRLWAHRVNTLGKMMEAARAFHGVEIDVLFQRGELLVNHPPAPLSGLTLDELLAYANRLNPKLALWLDVKNLDEKNGAAVLAALRQLEARHSIRGRALVETGHTGPAAAALRAAGFQTSYYLIATSGCDPAQLESLLALRRFAAVSYDFKERDAAERCAGDAVRKLKLRTYTWDLQGIDPARREAYSAYSGVLLTLGSRFADWR